MSIFVVLKSTSSFLSPFDCMCYEQILKSNYIIWDNFYWHIFFNDVLLSILIQSETIALSFFTSLICIIEICHILRLINSWLFFFQVSQVTDYEITGDNKLILVTMNIYSLFKYFLLRFIFKKLCSTLLCDQY